MLKSGTQARLPARRAPGPHARTAFLGLALILSTVAITACAPGLGGSIGDPAPSPSISPTAYDPLADPGREALAAYRGMWAAYVKAIGIPDPDHPELERYATGGALRVLVDGIEAVQRDGLAGRGAVVLDPEVTELVPNTAAVVATIVDCVDTSGTELYRTDGEPYEDSPGGYRRAEAAVGYVDNGQWKVVRFALYEVGSCDR